VLLTVRRPLAETRTVVAVSYPISPGSKHRSSPLGRSANSPAAFRVMSIPTLVIMREDLVLYTKSGALSLEDLIARARALDMDQVRSNRAARQQTA
jgi:hypothetical protein